MKKNDFLALFEKCPDDLKNLAFTHSSYANQHGEESNERIEFLGDSVLSTIVTDYLYKHFHQTEGKMSKVRARFVCTENLSKLADKLGIEKNIKLGKSFKGKPSEAIKADTIECMIGAIYLSFGLASISTAVLEALDVKVALSKGLKPNDFKSDLQEFVQLNKMKLEYKTETYLLDNNIENFRANVLIDNKFISYGQGSTKRLAEQNAAQKAIKKLNKSI